MSVESRTAAKLEICRGPFQATVPTLPSTLAPAPRADRNQRTTVLLTGATGFLGRYLLRELLENTDHDVIVRQGEHRERHRIRGRAGQSIELGPPRADAPDPDRVEPPPPSTRPGSGGLSPWFFGVGAGLTALSTVLLIWSGVDTLDGVDAFNAMPTPEAFEEGQAKELRTNVLIGITAGLAVVTLLFGVLADWDGEPAPSTTAGVFFDGRAGGAWLRTSF